MKVTLKNIYGASNILGLLVEQQLPIRIAFKLTRLITRLNEEYTNLDTTRRTLLKKYGTESENSDPNNPSYTFTPENQDKFSNEFGELLEEKVEIDWDPLSIDDLGSGLTLSVRELNTIGFIFKEFEDIMPETVQETVENKEEVATA